MQRLVWRHRLDSLSTASEDMYLFYSETWVGCCCTFSHLFRPSSASAPLRHPQSGHARFFIEIRLVACGGNMMVVMGPRHKRYGHEFNHQIIQHAGTSAAACLEEA